MASGRLEVDRALAAILERYAAANARKREIEQDRDAELATRAQAAAELESLATEFFCLSYELGETLFFLLRHAIDKQPGELRGLLMDFLGPHILKLIRPELESLAQAVAKLERRR
jgi:hypothetical protein